MEFYDFDPNDRAQIEAALKDPNPDNPVAKAIAVRLDALRAVLEQAVATQGALPTEITVTKPSTVLDEIVLTLFRDMLAQTPGAPPLRILDYARQ